MEVTVKVTITLPGGIELKDLTLEQAHALLDALAQVAELDKLPRFEPVPYVPVPYPVPAWPQYPTPWQPTWTTTTTFKAITDTPLRVCTDGVNR